MSSVIENEVTRLTQFSHGSGCGCKIAPAVLEKILQSNQSAMHFPQLLVGSETKDDAAVFYLDSEKAIISTTDFFTPIVDDPFDFGRIAATNALSDIYAMGGSPLMAVAILGWPVDKLPIELAGKVMEGAKKICSQAGIPIAGGHSIDSPEPFFGLAVNGIVHPDKVVKNNTANEGDLIFITKPLGIGVLSTAMKKGLITEAHKSEVIEIMTTLNSAGKSLAESGSITSMTDVTGFGLLGHLIEMAEGASLSVELDYEKIPRIEGVDTYINQFCFPDNTYRNWNAFEKKVEGVTGMSFVTLSDPQTSGGLMVSVKPESLNAFQDLMQKLNLADFAQNPIGKFIGKSEQVVKILNG